MTDVDIVRVASKISPEAAAFMAGWDAHKSYSNRTAEIAAATGAPEPLATMTMDHVDNRARWARESRDIEAMIDNAEEDGD